MGYKVSKTFKDKVRLKALKLFNVNYKDLFKKVDDELRKYSVDKYENVAPLNFVFNSRVRNKHYYDEIEWLPFEFIKIPLASQYDTLLTEHYGDYMKPVKAPNMHGGVIFDVDKPYTEYLENGK
jgi:lipopolysaccharide cholinephosphotransferase